MIFVGKRPNGGVTSGPGTVYIIDEENMNVRRLLPRRRVRGRGFVGGFSWGYRGDGPMSLSLRLLLELTNDEELSLNLYLPLLEEVIANLKANCWAIDADDIRNWIADQVNAAEDVR